MAHEIFVLRAVLLKIRGIGRCGLATGMTEQLFGVARGALQVVADIVEAPHLIPCLAVTISTLLGRQE